MGGCFKGGFIGCMTCVFDGFLRGCLEGCEEGCGDCLNCRFPSYKKCEIDCETGLHDGCDGCKNSRDGIENDIEQTYKNVGDNSKAKYYLIYLTILGTWIGAVLGIALTIQQKRKEEIKNEKNRKQQAEEERKHMQEDGQWFKAKSERLWQEMQNWLSS